LVSIHTIRCNLDLYEPTNPIFLKDYIAIKVDLGRPPRGSQTKFYILSNIVFLLKLVILWYEDNRITTKISIDTR
jgi:hypothetical protein